MECTPKRRHNNQGGANQGARQRVSGRFQERYRPLASPSLSSMPSSSLSTAGTA
jgi:hypothetical protein